MNKKFQKAVATVCLGTAVLTLTPAVSMAETAGANVNTGSFYGRNCLSSC